MIKITYYLDTISSWCYYFEPTWRELKERYAEVAEFDWCLTLIPPSGLPGSIEEEEWYYRRSGTITKFPQMLNANWFDPDAKEYLIPNVVAQAAKELGEYGDEVRLAITEAAILEGLPINQLDTCIQAALSVSDLNMLRLTEVAEDPMTEEKVRESTARFHSYGINQRPAIFIESEIEDRAIFSGVIKTEPLIATIDAMLEDVKAYRAWAAHMGPSWKERVRI